MNEATESRMAQMIALRPAMDAAHERATRDALLEHARMGRSVCEGRGGGKVVWIEPEEIFARYGLDANGKPKP